MWWESTGLTFILIAIAEIGDKSQLVCMTLAARHGRAMPVIYGALAAFSLLNGAAVLFGSTLTAWLPETSILATMAILFAAFGIHSLLHSDEGDDDDDAEISGHGLFITAFLMLFAAELGDKTQIAVAGLSGLYSPSAVWIGATIALILTSIAGVMAGKTVLRRLPMVWLHRLAGGLFLGLSGLATWRFIELI